MIGLHKDSPGLDIRSNTEVMNGRIEFLNSSCWKEGVSDELPQRQGPAWCSRIVDFDVVTKILDFSVRCRTIEARLRLAVL